MIILIPLGGLGERFKKLDYKEPKALIKVFGKPILYYLLDNIDVTNIDFVYIPYNKEYLKYRFEDTLKKDYPNIKFKFFILEKNTEGAAETIHVALQNYITINDTPILCLDSDNFYSINIVKLWNGENKIFTFEDNNNNPIYSYVNVVNKKIIDIVEKEKISNYACTGAYGFKSHKQLLHYTQDILDKKIKQKGEYYTSNVIKEMISNNVTFSNEIIEQKYWHCLGTPIQLKQFYNNYPSISCITNNNKIKKKRICFDLDNTLVTFPKITNDYTTVEPIYKNIEYLKYLKKFGHTIIIYTARRMKSCEGNVGKVLSSVGKITFETLEKFNIPFDEIYFGKPLADVYIDDLALNCFDDMEKSLGYYTDIILPRDFNSLELSTIEIYLKKSNDLSGEIYYYNNIPFEIKDLFPLFIDYDINNQWYKVEKIIGLTISTLYSSQILNKEMLMHVMNSIKRIQNTTIKTKQDINIYDNYCKKMKSRFETYDYSQFKNSDSVYEQIYNNLFEYENLKKGRQTIIHGDAVMTNILINNYEKIKFIDMRGKVGDELTIQGDWLYDWAKIYQSLVGYDKILQNTNIDINYEKNMIQIFKEYFISLYSEEDFNYLKIITQSLLFTLIPLHNNTKCIEYFNLIYTISSD